MFWSSLATISVRFLATSAARRSPSTMATASAMRRHDQLVPPGPTQAHGGEARALLPLPRRARHLHCGRTDRPGFRHHGDEIAEGRAVRRSRLFVYPPALYA